MVRQRLPPGVSNWCQLALRPTLGRGSTGACLIRERIGRDYVHFVITLRTVCVPVECTGAVAGRTPFGACGVPVLFEIFEA